jgi:hypothetical protein
MFVYYRARMHTSRELANVAKLVGRGAVALPSLQIYYI